MVRKKKVPLGDRVFDIFVYLFVGLICIAMLFPIYYMLVVSISDGNAVLRGEVLLWPKGLNAGAYKAVFNNMCRGHI